MLGGKYCSQLHGGGVGVGVRRQDHLYRHVSQAHHDIISRPYLVTFDVSGVRVMGDARISR